MATAGSVQRQSQGDLEANRRQHTDRIQLSDHRGGSVTRFVTIGMGLVFIFSAAVQYNDPDLLRWVSIYVVAAAMSFLSVRNILPWWLYVLTAMLAIAWAAVTAIGVDAAVYRQMFGTFGMACPSKSRKPGRPWTYASSEYGWRSWPQGFACMHVAPRRDDLDDHDLRLFRLSALLLVLRLRSLPAQPLSH